jgi:3'-phosphoadenosine 5'-phosphosulfate sulfotransferase (PAPS reductase)/FAD synthetase
MDEFVARLKIESCTRYLRQNRMARQAADLLGLLREEEVKRAALITTSERKKCSSKQCIGGHALFSGV